MLDYYKGMDISFLQEYVEKGMKTYDVDGTQLDPLALAKKHGVNAMRLRIWHTPENVPESGGYCSLERTIAMAKKIKQEGFDFLLDFHYSDWWADPGQQRKPKAWENLHGAELEEAVYTYTKQVLCALREAGAMPDMVQIGNEIRSGLLFPDGELPAYDSMVRLVNAGIKAARETGGDSLLIMIHLDQGGRYFYIKDWFDHAFAAGLADFDVIGLSYYPFWHGTFTDLKETTQKLIQDFKKPIILAETAHAWRKSKNGFIDEAQEKIAGFVASPSGQRMVLDMDNTIMASLPDKMGRGIYYWEPLCIPRDGEGGWAENMGILDECGQAMEAIHSFEFVRDDAKPELPAKVYQPKRLTVPIHSSVQLPEEVKVLYRDGSIQSHRVKWEHTGALQANEIGTIFAKGAVDKFNEFNDGWIEPVVQEIEVVEKLTSQENLFADANWDDGLTQWETSSSEDGVNVQLYPEFEDPFPAPPVNAVRVEGVKNFTFCISQKKENLAPGQYVLKAQYAGTDTTGVEVYLFAEKTIDEAAQASERSERYQTVIHPTKEWQEAELHFSIEKSCTLTAGLTISAPPVYGMVRRFLLYKEDGSGCEKNSSTMQNEDKKE